MHTHESVVKALQEFIKNNYSKKIVEVGCGKFSAVALALRPFFQVIATDVLETEVVDRRLAVIYIKDDVNCPDLRLYQGACLIFSIRPPLEIQRSILALSQRIGADMLIKPFASEIIEDVRLSLLNFRGLPLYLFRNRRQTCA